MKKIVILLIFAFCQSAFAKPDIVNYFDNLQNIQATFDQIVEQDNKVIQESSGTVALAKPYKFKWDYHTPEIMQLISNGVTFIHYDSELMQATAKPIQDIGSSPLMVLLNGEKSLADLFQISDIPIDDKKQFAAKSSSNLFKLIPKKQLQDDNSVKWVIIGFDNNDQLNFLSIEDQLGITRFYFQNILLNKNLPTDMFHFNPPEGADILGTIR